MIVKECRQNDYCEELKHRILTLLKNEEVPSIIIEQELDRLEMYVSKNDQKNSKVELI